MSTALPHAAPEPEPPHAEPRPRRWTREEYYRMAEAGILKPAERVELIDGEIIEHMSPIGPPHRLAIYKATQRLAEAFGAGFYVDHEIPIVLSDEREPQPDVVVARGIPDTYADHHPGPAEIALLVEVSESTLGYDRSAKAALYAGEGIPEYWIVNLPQRRLEVHRDRQPSIGYRTVTLYTEADAVAPLAAPDARILVADLLPPRIESP